MSSHKKRRIDGVETPKPMSAISALAARRREAASTPPATQKTPEANDDKPIVTTTNYFSPLQRSDSQNGSSSTPKRVFRNPRANNESLTRLLLIPKPLRWQVIRQALKPPNLPALLNE
ncbi:Polynucleotide 5'-hydroxyl-kinase grc3 [Fusarium falciforme]|nr:Polynucleotide 5'-hydroxyl-kinase grc3 [Fusarium falciforme]